MSFFPLQGIRALEYAPCSRSLEAWHESILSFYDDFVVVDADWGIRHVHRSVTQK